MPQRELGDKTGANLWDMAHGRDARIVQPPKPRRCMVIFAPCSAGCTGCCHAHKYASDHGLPAACKSSIVHERP